MWFYSVDVTNVFLPVGTAVFSSGLKPGWICNGGLACNLDAFQPRINCKSPAKSLLPSPSRLSAGTICLCPQRSHFHPNQ